MKKVLIITQRDPFFIDSFLRNLEVSKDIDIEILDLPNFNKGKLWALKRAYELYGILGTIKLIFIRAYQFFTVKNISSTSLKSSKDLDIYLSSLKANDIVLSLSAPSIINVKKIPKDVKAINIHSGRLPDYAGMMPIFWQLMNDEKFLTLTFHELAENIDTGDIYHEEIIPTDKSLFDLSVQAKIRAAKIFSEKFMNGSYKTIKKQTSSKHVLNKFPLKQEILQLRKKKKFL
tara:strand:+ start:1358 stop:2053 length:696 start_codon:yes stop_codon:yes gene_type:complete